MGTIDTKRIHRFMGYSLILLGGFFAFRLILTAYMEEAMIDEHTIHLERSNNAYESGMAR